MERALGWEPQIHGMTWLILASPAMLRLDAKDECGRNEGWWGSASRKDTELPRDSMAVQIPNPHTWNNLSESSRKGPWICRWQGGQPRSQLSRKNITISFLALCPNTGVTDEWPHKNRHDCWSYWFILYILTLKNCHLLTLILPVSFSLLSTCYTREKPPVDGLPAEMMLMEGFTVYANDGRGLIQSLSSLSPCHQHPQPQHLGWSRWPSWIIKFYISWHVLHCTLSYFNPEQLFNRTDLP